MAARPSRSGPAQAPDFDADLGYSRRHAGGALFQAQILKKPAKIGPNFARIQTGKNRALTMPNIRPDLIRI
jgi:hypothetical protein